VCALHQVYFARHTCPVKLDDDISKLKSNKERKLLSEVTVASNDKNNDDDNNNDNNTPLRLPQEQWFQQEDGVLVVYALSFLNVKTLLQRETVSKRWRKLCKTAIRNKCCGSPKAFQSKQELTDTIWKYYRCQRRNWTRETMEEIACTYGYPIDSWDVSQVTDMSNLFENM
jgi:hypothetical protein